MEAIIYTSCFNVYRKGLDCVMSIGLIYILFFFLISNLNYYYINFFLLFNGITDILLPCYIIHLLETNGRNANNLIYLNNRRYRRNQDLPREILIVNRLQENNWKNTMIYINESFTCSICFDDRDKRAIFHNCDHFMCDNCVEKIYKNECPFCRMLIVNI